MAGEVERWVDPKARSHVLFANGWGSVTSHGLGTVSQGVWGHPHGQPAPAPPQHPKKLGQLVNEERDLPRSSGKFLPHTGGFHGGHGSEGALPVTAVTLHSLPDPRTGPSDKGEATAIPTGAPFTGQGLPGNY